MSTTSNMPHLPNTMGVRQPASYSPDAALRHAEKKGPQWDDTRLLRNQPALREDLDAGDRHQETQVLLLEGDEKDWEYEIREYVPGERNPIVFFDIAIGGVGVGRVEMILRDDVAPRTCHNFRVLCTGEREKLWYKGSKIHRVIPGFVAQGGDFTRGNGSGGACVYGEDGFEDENFELKHSRRGTLSVATQAGVHKNTSHFFITLQRDLSFLDGKHVVFGFVSAGMDTLDRIEQAGTTQGRTHETVTIANCGQLR